MSNLLIENLSGFRSSQGLDGQMSESRVQREMTQQGLETSSGSGGVTFSDMLKDSFDEVNKFQHQADHAIKELVAGRNKNVHETMLAIDRAETSLKLAMQVRNKILDAYREIMRMQV